MKRQIRFVIVVTAVLVLAALASSNVAWAGLSPQPAEPGIVPQEAQPVSSEYKGTVRPPNCEGLTITESGDYSVCGVAVISVEFTTDEDVHLLASLDPYIPPGVSKVMAGPVVIGCLVDGVSDPGPHDRHADIKMCFAANPKNKSVIKFYDEAAGAWVALETTEENGQACATVNYSGKYVLVKK